MLVGELKKYNELFTGWSRKEVNLTSQMIKFCRIANLTIEDFERYADYLEKQQFLSEKAAQNEFLMLAEYITKHIKRCDECGKPMNVSDVNISDCTRVPGKSKSVWTCTDMRGCGNQVWNTKPSFFHMNKLERAFLKTIEGITLEELADSKVDRSKIKFFYRPAAARNKQPKKPCGGKRE